VRIGQATRAGHKTRAMRLPSTLSGRNRLAWQMMLAACAGARAIRRTKSYDAIAKADGSPVTAADLASDRAIRRSLCRQFEQPEIVSEESAISLSANSYFLVDPLDGTREFIAGTGEFAICVAKIEQGRPVAGVILAPDQNLAWFAGETAFRVELDANLKPLQRTCQSIRTEKSSARTYVTSRFHLDEAVRHFGQTHPDWTPVTIGAALKFAAIAEGRARLYPRGPGPQAWDIAAGEALLRACGGLVLDLEGNEIHYHSGEGSTPIKGFIAGIDAAEMRAALAQWKAF
jgi:3'(2'), 5'-bisphosphate nucleotidase